MPKKELIDKYNRRINYLRVSVTDRCNFRCRHCMPPEGIPLLPREAILTYEEINQVVNAAVRLGIIKIRVTGGEPLVRTDIIHLLETLVKTPGVERVSLTTNGFLLTEYSEAIKNIGLYGVNIGLNSLTEDGFNQLTGVKGVNKVMEGIKFLLNAGFRNVKINTVLIKGINDRELFDFVRLTFDYPLTLRFIEYMPCGVWENSTADWTIQMDEILNRLKALGKLTTVKESPGSGPAEYYQLAGAQGLIGLITPVSRPFCRQCNRLRLTADGHLKSCLLTNDLVDLKPILRGNLSAELCQTQLAEAFIRAASLKPAVHQNEELSPMSRIGG